MKTPFYCISDFREFMLNGERYLKLPKLELSHPQRGRVCINAIKYYSDKCYCFIENKQICEEVSP